MLKKIIKQWLPEPTEEQKKILLERAIRQKLTGRTERSRERAARYISNYIAEQEKQCDN